MYFLNKWTLITGRFPPTHLKERDTVGVEWLELRLIGYINTCVY